MGGHGRGKVDPMSDAIFVNPIHIKLENVDHLRMTLDARRESAHFRAC
jgi:hypothetical protein